MHRIVPPQLHTRKRRAEGGAHPGTPKRNKDSARPALGMEGQASPQAAKSPAKQAPPLPEFTSPSSSTRLVTKSLQTLDSPLSRSALLQHLGATPRPGAGPGTPGQCNAEPGFLRTGLTCFLNATLAVLLRIPQFHQVLLYVQDAIRGQHANTQPTTQRGPLTAALLQVHDNMNRQRHTGHAVDMTAVVRVRWRVREARTTCFPRSLPASPFPP